MILFQGVTIAADFALILHQNNTILPRPNDIWMEKTPHTIADLRFHGIAPAARGKHTFGIANSLRHQSHSWFFQLFRVHITDTDELAASDSKTPDFHLGAGLSGT